MLAAVVATHSEPRRNPGATPASGAGYPAPARVAMVRMVAAIARAVRTTLTLQ